MGFIFTDTGAIALADSEYFYTVCGQLQLGGVDLLSTCHMGHVYTVLLTSQGETPVLTAALDTHGVQYNTAQSHHINGC